MQLARVAQWIEYLTSNQMVGGVRVPPRVFFYVFLLVGERKAWVNHNVYGLY